MDALKRELAMAAAAVRQGGDVADQVTWALRQEVRRQAAQYGEQNKRALDGTGPDAQWLAPVSCHPADLVEILFRDDYEAREAEGTPPTWMHLVREELAEAFKEREPEALSAELAQVAALLISWIAQLLQRDL